MQENRLSLKDVATETGNEDLITMVDNMLESTTLLADASWQESNSQLEHISGNTIEKLICIEGSVQIPEKYKMYHGDFNALKQAKEDACLHGLGELLERHLLYGKETESNQFNGFLTRCNTLTDIRGVGLADGKQKEYIALDAGGKSETSNGVMIFVVWGNQATNMLYPRNSSNNGLGCKRAAGNFTDKEGKIHRVAISQFGCSAGLSVASRFALVAIRNIETDTDLAPEYMPKLYEAMHKVWAFMPAQFKSRVKVYTSPDVILALRMCYKDKVRPAVYVEAIPHNPHGDIIFDQFIIRECKSMQ